MTFWIFWKSHSLYFSILTIAYLLNFFIWGLLMWLFEFLNFWLLGFFGHFWLFEFFENAILNIFQFRYECVFWLVFNFSLLLGVTDRQTDRQTHTHTHTHTPTSTCTHTHTHTNTHTHTHTHTWNTLLFSSGGIQYIHFTFGNKSGNAGQNINILKWIIILKVKVLIKLMI